MYVVSVDWTEVADAEEDVATEKPTNTPRLVPMSHNDAKLL